MTANQIIQSVKSATAALQAVDNSRADTLLEHLADLLEGSAQELIEANACDVALLPESDPMRDRLMLDRGRIKGIADGIRNVASLPSPVGQTIDSTVRPNGMRIDKRRVPFGVIGIIYEARPNVTFDVFSLCFKTRNCVILKGGHAADNSNRKALKIIHRALSDCSLPTDCVALLGNDRKDTTTLLEARGSVDLIIPRGGRKLIEYVRDNARVPVIETGAGVVHVYVDADASVDKARAIVNNAKTRRVSVCNALDCTILHSKRLTDAKEIFAPLAQHNVVIYADPRAYEALLGGYPDELLCKADSESFGTEYLDYKMAVKTVDSLEEALAHIACFSSGHSDAIVTESSDAAEVFTSRVDSACVYVNTSTAFTDGGEFGFGAEIGISTQKLHARGPMGLPELTTYKYIISGNGQTR